MSNKPYVGKIPFLKLKDGTEEQLSYPEHWGGDFFERDNYEFEDTLEYIGFGRGRSAVSLYWRSKKTGNKFSMFASGLETVAQSNQGLLNVEGKWTFKKAGQNYGLIYLGPIDKS